MKTIKSVDYAELDVLSDALVVTVKYLDGTTEVFDKPSEEKLAEIHQQILKQML